MRIETQTFSNIITAQRAWYYVLVILAFAVGWSAATGQALTSLVFIAGIGIFLVLIISPLNGLLLWLIFFPFLERFVGIDFGEGIPAISFTRVIFVLLLMSAFLFRSSKERVNRVRPDRIGMCMVLFSGVFLFSVFRSVEPVHAGQVALDSFVLPFVLYFLAKR